jgi:hypothetical protein
MSGHGAQRGSRNAVRPATSVTPCPALSRISRLRLNALVGLVVAVVFLSELPVSGRDTGLTTGPERRGQIVWL